MRSKTITRCMILVLAMLLVAAFVPSVTQAQEGCQASGSIPLFPSTGTTCPTALTVDQEKDIVITVQNTSSTTPAPGVPVSAKLVGEITHIMACQTTACLVELPGTLEFVSGPEDGCISHAAGVLSCAASGLNRVIIDLEDTDGVTLNTTGLTEVATIRVRAVTPVGSEPVCGQFGERADTGPNDIVTTDAACAAEATGAAAGSTNEFFPLPPPPCQIQITKAVALDDNCDGVADGPFVESVTQDAGECVVYEICVTNTGEQDIDDVTVADPKLVLAPNLFGTLIPDQTLCNTVPSDIPAATCIDGTPFCECEEVVGENTVEVATAVCSATQTNACDEEGSICLDTANVACVSEEICRTPGFWGTHGCPVEGCEEMGGSCAQNITQAVIDNCTGCLNVCGEIITNTLVEDAESALEAICVGPQGDIKFQLARQLTATALNCCVSGGGESCSGISIEPIFSACNQICATAGMDENGNTDSFLSLCVEQLDCFNNGGINTTCFIASETPGCDQAECEASVCSYDPFCCDVEWDDICVGEALTDPNCEITCQTGTCQPTDSIPDGLNQACGENLPPCPEFYECVPLEGNCHDRDLPLEELGLTECTGGDGSLQQGSTGSSKACNEAVSNDCAVLSKPVPDAECGAKVKVDSGPKVFNQGEGCCDSGTQDDEFGEVCECGDICTIGTALNPSCGDCVAQICAQDPFCCTTAWDDICVGEVSSVCGLTCD